MVAGCTLTTVSRQSIEQSGEQGKADAGRVIQASGFDTTLDITGELLAKYPVLSADRSGRAQERDDQPQDVLGYSADRSRQLQHALIMPEAAGGCRRWVPTQTRRELLRTTGPARRHFSLDSRSYLPFGRAQIVRCLEISARPRVNRQSSERASLPYPR